LFDWIRGEGVFPGLASVQQYLFQAKLACNRDKKKSLTDDIMLEICRRCSQKLMLG